LDIPGRPIRHRNGRTGRRTSASRSLLRSVPSRRDTRDADRYLWFNTAARP
jgi:hypothetical protein